MIARAPTAPRCVWILNHYAAVSDGQSRAFELGRHLVRRGHSVTVFAAGHNHYTGAEVHDYGDRGWCEEQIDGVRFVWIRISADRLSRFRNMSGFAFGASRAGLQLTERPAVVIGSCPHPLAGLAAWFLARIKRARFLYEVRDLWPQSGVDQGLLDARAPTTVMLRVLERFLMSRADGIISVLANLRRYLDVRGIHQENVWLIPNGADIQQFDPSDRRAEPRGVFRVLYVGGFSNYHGLDVIVAAADLLKQRRRTDIEITMVGEGPVKCALIRGVADRGLTNVRFGDHKPKHELPALLRTGDVTLFTFRRLSVLDYGISPLKVFDYMAAGRPVIFAASAFNNPVAEANAGITVEPEDPVALADAIERCADMPPAELEAMGRRGRDFMAAHHSIEVLGPRFEAAIRGGAAP